MFKKENLAPIVLFAYTRLDTLRKVVEALSRNTLADQSQLFIFVDGPKIDTQLDQIQTVRDYVKGIEGFAGLSYHFSETNIGLDASVINGVTQVVNEFGKAIVLEDDIITSPNFLCYMNQALDFYQDNQKVMQIGAYGVKIRRPHFWESDVYFYARHCSWGWGIWKDRWDSVDWKIEDWKQIQNDRAFRHNFNKNGSDMYSMLKNCMEGGNMWDIRFSYNLYKQGKYVVYPFVSKSWNIGYGGDATHCKDSYSRFKVDLDTGIQQQFLFRDEVESNQIIHRRVYHYHSLHMRAYSLFRRIMDKALKQ